LDDKAELRVDYLLEGVSKNNPGQQIANLDIVNIAYGMPTTLNSLIQQCNTDATVLFYDPACEECATVISHLAGEPGPVIAVCVTNKPYPTLPRSWYSYTACDFDQLDGHFLLPRLTQLYTVTPAGLIK